MFLRVCKVMFPFLLPNPGHGGQGRPASGHRAPRVADGSRVLPPAG
uniref:Uncharacterized protein n=1 Tax=Anguilla anguilla TaxID=7936 RepID=A0A0E9PHS2_ANGAN